MKKVFLYIALVIFISAAAGIQAQTLTKDAVLQNPSGNRITLGTPASVTNNKILLPGTLGLQGAILYISSVASTTGTTTWLNPGSNGDVLTLSGGVPTWSASPALNFWGYTGNGQTVTDGTNNLLGTTTSAPLRLITAGTTRVTIGATGGMTVAGTSGTSNVTLSSLASATGTTGRVMFATDATGALNALAVPASNGQVLTSTTGGVLSWTSSPTLNYWDLAGNGHTVTDGTNNLLGTTTAAPLRLITGGAANTRVLISATGDVLVNGTAGTPNVRTTSLTSASAGSTGGVMFADASGYLNRLAVPASNGQILTSTTAGVLSWTSSPTLTYWDLVGNGHTVTDNTNNLLGTTTAAPLRLITGGAANTRVLISATGDVLVNGTAGTPNVRATSLTSASASSTGGVLFADASGYINRLAVPGSNGQVLTSTTGGALTWTSPGSSSGWALTGNSGTTAGTNFIGTTDSIDWVVKTNSGGTTGGERMRVDAMGQVGIGNITPDVMLDLKGGIAIRYATLNLRVGATNNSTHNDVVTGDTTNLRISDTATYYSNIITGFTGGYDGKILHVFNSNPTQLTFKHESSSSTAANRIVNLAGQNTDVTVDDSGSVDLQYDATMSRWLITGVRGAANNTANGNTYFARQTRDTSITNNAGTLFGCEIQVPCKPNVVHTLDGMLYMSSASAGNPKFNIAFDVPNDFVLLKVTAIGHNDNGTNTVAGSDIIQGDNAASADYQINSGTEMFVWISGIFINGPSTGTISLKWTNQANGQTTTVKNGSYLRLIPVQ